MREKPYLLIVEDDLDLSEMLTAYFRAQGYEAYTVAWGEDAVRLTREDPPDLILLDVRLPDIDGYEVCRRLCAHRRTQNVPIIFLTDRRDRADRLSGLELGVVDYVTKPFDIQELRLRVRNALLRANQMSRVNPVTGLLEGAPVDERLASVLKSDEYWAVLLVSVMGIDRFREQYGFVAADDVLRAVALIVSNVLGDADDQDSTAVHLAPHDFVIITNEDRLPVLRERIEQRLAHTIEFFYPLDDRYQAGQSVVEERLHIKIGEFTHRDGPPANLDAMKTAILNSRNTAN